MLGLLHARLGDAAIAERFAVRLERAQEPRDTVGLRHDLALEIRAPVALQAGRPDAALRLLEQARMAVATSERGSEGPQVVVVLNLFDQLRAARVRRSKSPK